MNYKNTIFLLLLSLGGSAQAISFRDYYRGNADLEIRPHEKEINDAVASGTLNLDNKHLTDLSGFNEVPGLTALRTLYLSFNQLTSLPQNIFHDLTGLRSLYLYNNQLTELPENIFHGLTRLQSLYLYHNQLAALQENVFQGLTALQTIDLSYNQFTSMTANIFRGLPRLQNLYLANNPISLNSAQLRKKLGLPAYVSPHFKTPEQKQIERSLFASIENADVSRLRQRLYDIQVGKVRAPERGFIDISKIRNAKGDNLLHAAIREAAKRIGIVQAMTVGLPEKEKVEAREVQAEQKATINDRYMKIISVILSCGEECVQDMLFTPNAQGEQVIDAIVAKLGLDSPIYEAIIKGLTPEESPAATSATDH